MANSRIGLTIFQKMLVAPIAGILLYSVYFIYTYGEHRVGSESIASVRDNYLPVLELMGENAILFDDIAESLKDAVLAGEKQWVLDTLIEKKRIEDNLQQLSGYTSLVPRQRVAGLREQFQRYYQNAAMLSRVMLGEAASTDELNRLIDNVEKLHGDTRSGFRGLRDELQRRFTQRINATEVRLNRLMLTGAAFGVVLLLLVITVTFVMSLSTRRRLDEVNRAMREIAQEEPDFSRRLAQRSNDELGELVGWFNLLSDKLERNYKEIELLSITDKLTQLYNRTKMDELFEIELNKARRYAFPLSVILLDIDHFKQVNDTYGHQVGDRVLQQVANLIHRNLRNTDFVGRWGGEEFIVLSPNTTLVQACQEAEKIRHAVDNEVFAAVDKVTVSLGVASYRSGDDADRMTRRADQALYLAKERGRNRVIDERAAVDKEAATDSVVDIAPHL